MAKIVPLVLILLGLLGGAGAGYVLRPDKEPEPQAEVASDALPEAVTPCEGTETCAEPVGEIAAAAGSEADSTLNNVEFIALQRQLIVPLVVDNRVGALMVLSLSIEAESGSKETVYDREPKLRDAFLQVLFRHANTGGFDGVFTSGESMSDLRSALDGAATEVLGPIFRKVLVTEVLRQEV